VVPFQAQQTTGVNTAPPPTQAAPPPRAQAAPPPRERKSRELTRDQREIQRRQAERHRKTDKDDHVIIEERRSTTGAAPRERVPDRRRVIEEGPPVEVYRGPPPERDHGPGLSDLPIIGPLFGPPHGD
jgi:hypothetical protein